MRGILLTRRSLDEQARRRAAALAATFVFFAVLLILLGLGIVVLAVLVAAACVAAVLLARRYGALAAAAQGVRSIRARGIPPLSRSVRRRAARSWESSPDDATVEMALVGSLADRHDFGRAPLPTRTQVAERLRVLSSATQRRIGAALAPRSADPELSPGVLSREAARCNGLGLALRRAGHARQAATLHQAARLIFAEAGDSRSAALTANVLGVALAEAGRQDAALEQFAQARTLLRALGERQWEGKVLANIGLAKHRVGEDDQAVDFLQSALELLTPETEAYGRVERRLKQAG